MVQTNDSSNVEIRIIKLNNYISKYPTRAFGYYGLGEVQYSQGNHSAAIKYYKQALDKDSKNARAIAGLIKCYVPTKQYIKAVKTYSLNIPLFSVNKVAKLSLIRSISSNLSLKEKTQISVFAKIKNKNINHKISKAFSKNKQNIVAAIILTTLYAGSISYPSWVTPSLKFCVKLKGINDALRWKILKPFLDDDFFNDPDIAGLFKNIPSNGCTTEYANLIFEQSLIQDNVEKVNRIFHSASLSLIPISTKNIWLYLNWCKESNTFDTNTVKYCKKLINLGWIDPLVAEVYSLLKQEYPHMTTASEDSMLKMLGYLDEEKQA